VEVATQACELADWQDPVYITTLAEAYAENNDFEKAIRWQRKALELVAAGSAARAISNDWGMRIQLYQAGKPYREK